MLADAAIKFGVINVLLAYIYGHAFVSDAIARNRNFQVKGVCQEMTGAEQYYANRVYIGLISSVACLKGVVYLPAAPFQAQYGISG